jgi:hypothetical protein
MALPSIAKDPGCLQTCLPVREILYESARECKSLYGFAIYDGDRNRLLGLFSVGCHIRTLPEGMQYLYLVRGCSYCETGNGDRGQSRYLKNMEGAVLLYNGDAFVIKNKT